MQAEELGKFKKYKEFGEVQKLSSSGVQEG
jgi:hypothetical protein